MERVPVDSQAIKSAGWEASILELEFPSGKVYQYSGVPRDVFVNLLDGRSAGRYYHESIKRYYPETPLNKG